MKNLRILVCDGNTVDDRASFVTFTGCTPGSYFEALLKHYDSGIETEVVFPADPAPPQIRELETYDGILFTGSNSHIYEQNPGNLRQIEFAKRAFASGTPMFGVCWGLQLAAVAAGGEVRRTTGKCETPFALDIRLTAEGSTHPMHQFRTPTFDAFSFHSDAIVTLPDHAVVTAFNERFIQAAEIRHGNSVFWGVQYHPELSGVYQAGFLRESAASLVADGCYETLDNVESAAQAIARFETGSEVSKADLRYFEQVNTNEFEFKPIEIINWMELLVIPTARQKFLAGERVEAQG